MKKVFSAICALALAVALPVSAFAAGSPEDDVFYGDGIWIAGGTVTSAGPTDQSAAPAGYNVLASYYIDGTVDEGATAGVEFYVDESHGGQKVGMWIDHNEDGAADEAYNVTLSDDGWAYLEMSSFSIITATDELVKAPKTGIDTSAIALGTIAAMLVAGGAVVVLRKKIAE